MASRTPTSILMLIDRRNRLEGELEKLSVLKRAAVDLHRVVSVALKSIDQDLSKVQRRYDPERVRKIRSMKTTARGQHGLLTRSIIGALKAASGVPQSTGEVFDVVLAHWPAGAARPDTDTHFRLNMRRRLRELRAQGFVLSPEIGGGGRTTTTWMLNPALLIQGQDTESTLFDVGDLGSSRRTTGTGRTDELA